MEVPPLLLQTAGSLLAILALYALSRMLGLGGKPVLRSDSDVQRAADEVESGFEASRIAIGRGGVSALARDPEGRIMVIKRHGNQFAGRVLNSAAHAREEVDAIIVDPAETQFGTVRLSIERASSWADAINRL